MENIGQWWLRFLNREPDWDLIVRLLDVSLWPLVTTLALVTMRPWRLIDHMLENGGEVGLGPATMKLDKRVQEIANAVEADEEAAPEESSSGQSPLAEAADPYTTVLNGWGKVIEGLELAVRETGVATLDKRNPMDTVTRLRRANAIGRKAEANIQALWDFRNRVVKAGSKRLERLGLTAAQADDYYATADRVRRSILNAIAYRRSTGALRSIVDKARHGMNPQDSIH